MTDNNFHLPRMMHKQSQQQQAQQDHQQILNAITERSRGIVQQQQQQETNDQDNHHNEQPNPQIVLHYQTMHEDQIIQDDQIIEEDHYVDDIEESNVEMIDEDGMAVTLTTVGSDNGGPATTIIHKPAFKKQQQNNFHLHPLPPPPSTQRANDIANLRQPKSINSSNVVNASAYNNNNNNTITKNSTSSNNHQYQSFIGRLVSKDNILLISQNVIEIGRNSSKSMVDFHVGKNSFVSRKHLILQYDGQDFNLVCASKNGVFIDGVFQRKSVEATLLPSSCTLRFPSTNIRIQFENLADQKHDPMPNKSTSVENTNVVYQPLKISIPEQEGGAKNIKSPFPSPTGTMSAANSCPTSPRQNYHDFYATHNNGSDYMDFPAPSTSGASHEDDLLKPPFSYAQLIVQSITAAHDKQLTLSGIYSYISKNYPYYRTGANKGWQNSIRHNLSLNRYFIKVPRSQDEPGKGSFWRIDPMSENKLIDQSYRKRRQRGGQGFRTPFGMPRSAPVSPSLMDNSQDNSPQDLRDVVLQSAPGSPRSHNYSTDGHRSTSFNSQYASFVSPQNTSQQPQNVLKRERDTELYEDTYYSDSDEYEPAKRPKV